MLLQKTNFLNTSNNRRIFWANLRISDIELHCASSASISTQTAFLAIPTDWRPKLIIDISLSTAFFLWRHKKSRSHFLKRQINDIWTEMYVSLWSGPPSVYKISTGKGVEVLAKTEYSWVACLIGLEGSKMASLKPMYTCPVYQLSLISSGNFQVKYNRESG